MVRDVKSRQCAAAEKPADNEIAINSRLLSPVNKRFLSPMHKCFLSRPRRSEHSWLLHLDSGWYGGFCAGVLHVRARSPSSPLSSVTGRALKPSTRGNALKNPIIPPKRSKSSCSLCLIAAACVCRIAGCHACKDLPKRPAVHEVCVARSKIKSLAAPFC